VLEFLCYPGGVRMDDSAVALLWRHTLPRGYSGSYKCLDFSATLVDVHGWFWCCIALAPHFRGATAEVISA